MKYSNKHTILDGIKFQSKREALRWAELTLLERAGWISGLSRQVPFELAPSVRFKGSTRAKAALKYWADFVYAETATGQTIVEDSKGVLTESFQIKRHLMLSVHKIDVRITK